MQFAGLMSAAGSVAVVATSALRRLLSRISFPTPDSPISIQHATFDGLEDPPESGLAAYVRQK